MSLWRRSRAVRITARIVLGLLAVLVVAWLSLYLSTERALRAELQRIRDAGEPTSLADLVPPQVPDDQNAALVYARYYAKAGPVAERLSFARPGDWELVSRFPSDAAVETQVRGVLARPEVTAALSDIRRASHLPSALANDRPEGGDNPPSLLVAHDVRYWLSARAVMAARDGDGAEALEWVAVIFRIAQQMEADPRVFHLVHWVRGHACRAGWRVLEATDVPAQRARALAREITTPDPWERARQQLLVIRAQTLDGFHGDIWAFFAGVGLQKGDLSPRYRALLGCYGSLLFRPIRNADELNCLRYFRDVLAAASVQSPVIDVRPPPRDRPYHVCCDRNPGAALEAWFLPVARFWRELDLERVPLGMTGRRAAYINIFRTGLVLVAHKQEHGEYPQTLADLRLPPGCDPTGDPFSGEALRYSRQGEGFVLYSVGPDGEDDGGRYDPTSEGDIVESLDH